MIVTWLDGNTAKTIEFYDEREGREFLESLQALDVTYFASLTDEEGAS